MIFGEKKSKGNRENEQVKSLIRVSVEKQAQVQTQIVTTSALYLAYIKTK